MENDKKPVVSEVKKPFIRMPLFIARRSRQLSLLLVVLLTLGLGYGAYFVYKQEKNSKPRKLPTVEVAGKKYQVDLVSQADDDQEAIAAAKATNEASLKKLEAKAANNQASIDEYVTLGHLYEMQGDTAKALETYRRARQMVTPRTPNHQNYISSLDFMIKALEKGN